MGKRNLANNVKYKFPHCHHNRRHFLSPNFRRQLDSPCALSPTLGLFSTTFLDHLVVIS
jgi:hypothetical protein